MEITLEQIQQYKSWTDIQLVNAYRKEYREFEGRDCSLYASVFFYRYEKLILKIISQWNRFKRRKHVYVTRSDLTDTLQTAYLGVLESFIRIRNVDTVNNFGSRIKAYIYYFLNQEYKHRNIGNKSLDDEEVWTDFVDLKASEEDGPNTRYATTCDNSLYFQDGNLDYWSMTTTQRRIFAAVYVYKYNYYKCGLMLCGPKARKAINESFYLRKKTFMNNIHTCFKIR